MSKITILVNLGTPDQPHENEVRIYLKEFLSDKYVIVNSSKPSHS